MTAFLGTPEDAALQRENWGAAPAHGTVRGVRTFVLRAPLGIPVLAGWWGGTWQRGENVAKCVPSWRTGDKPPRYDEEHEIVDLDCSCGHYAYWRVPAAQMVYGTVFAVIDGWGSLVTGDRGFRAERARILAVAPNPDAPDAWTFVRHARQISDYYAVPVVPDLDALLAKYPVKGPDNEDHS